MVVISASRYSPPSTSTSGRMRSRAVAHDSVPVSTHSVTTASTFCMNIDGTALTTAENTMHTAVTGTSTG